MSEDVGQKKKAEAIRSYFTKQSVSHLRKIVPPHRLPLMNAKSDSSGVTGSQHQVNLNKDVVVNLILSVS